MKVIISILPSFLAYKQRQREDNRSMNAKTVAPPSGRGVQTTDTSSSSFPRETAPPGSAQKQNGGVGPSGLPQSEGKQLDYDDYLAFMWSTKAKTVKFNEI